MLRLALAVVLGFGWVVAALAQAPAAPCEEQVKVWAALNQEVSAERERAQIQQAQLRVRLAEVERQLAEARKPAAPSKP